MAVTEPSTEEVSSPATFLATVSQSTDDSVHFSSRLSWERRSPKSSCCSPAERHVPLDSGTVHSQIVNLLLVLPRNAIVSCVDRGSALVRSIGRYGLTVARYNSFIGSNALFCCDRYKWSLDDIYAVILICPILLLPTHTII